MFYSMGGTEGKPFREFSLNEHIENPDKRNATGRRGLPGRPHGLMPGFDG